MWLWIVVKLMVVVDSGGGGRRRGDVGGVASRAHAHRLHTHRHRHTCASTHPTHPIEVSFSGENMCIPPPSPEGEALAPTHPPKYRPTVTYKHVTLFQGGRSCTLTYMPDAIISVHTHTRTLELRQGRGGADATTVTAPFVVHRCLASVKYTSRPWRHRSAARFRPACRAARSGRRRRHTWPS